MICVFNNKLLNISSTTYNFCVIVRGICSLAPEVKHSQLCYCNFSALISNVEVENIGSSEISNKKEISFDIGNRSFSFQYHKYRVFIRNRKGKH